jgi:hypothetical protein
MNAYFLFDPLVMNGLFKQGHSMDSLLRAQGINADIDMPFLSAVIKLF